MSRSIPISLFASAFLAASSADADAITDSCATLAPAEVCTCASQRLAEALSDTELAFYAMTAEQAAQLQAQGESLAEAWDQATERSAAAAGLSYSSAMKQLNAAGTAHRDAINACQT